MNQIWAVDNVFRGDSFFGALGDVGFMIVETAKFLRFDAPLGIFLLSHGAKPPPVNSNQDVSESQHQLCPLCC